MTGAGQVAADASAACVTCEPAALDATADGPLTEVAAGDASSDANSAADTARGDGGDASVIGDGAQAPGSPDGGDGAVARCLVDSSASPCEAGGWHDAQRPSDDVEASGSAPIDAGDPLGAERNAP